MGNAFIWNGKVETEWMDIWIWPDGAEAIYGKLMCEKCIGVAMETQCGTSSAVRDSPY